MIQLVGRRMLAITFAWLVVTAPLHTLAEPLTLEQALESALEHYPDVQAAWQAQQASEGRLLASEGGFDWRLESTGYGRLSGFYEGRSLDSQVVKPLAFANGRLFGGYKIANEDFPVYEDEYATRDGGQFKVGFALSLLRDRSIDARRFAMNESRLGVERAALDLAATRILVQHATAIAYLRWVTAGQIREVRRDLVDLALRRDEFLEVSVREGNAAAIALEENRANLASRRGRLIEAERDLIERAQELALYLRDDGGEMRIPSDDELPASMPVLPDVDLASIDEAMTQSTAQRPEMAMIDNEIAVQEQKLALADNSLLPRLDLKYEISRDLGDGSPSRSGTENVVGLQVEVPLQMRIGRGRGAEARANVRRLERKRQLLEDRIRVEIQRLAVEIDAARELVAVMEERVKRAATVERGERERLSAGASQIFLVNAREETTANARISLVAAHARKLQSITDFYASTVQLERFYQVGEVPVFLPME